MIQKKGAMFIDAPVSGGTSAAEEGSLTIMAGGDKCALKIASPIFLVLGDQITHVGDNGAGQIAKTANQIIVGLTIGAVAEALVLAKKAGVNPLQIKKALVNGFADSQVLKLHGERMIKNNFVPATVSAELVDVMTSVIESPNTSVPVIVTVFALSPVPAVVTVTFLAAPPACVPLFNIENDD